MAHIDDGKKEAFFGSDRFELLAGTIGIISRAYHTVALYPGRVAMGSSPPKWYDNQLVFVCLVFSFSVPSLVPRLSCVGNKSLGMRLLSPQPASATSLVPSPSPHVGSGNETNQLLVSCPAPPLMWGLGTRLISY